MLKKAVRSWVFLVALFLIPLSCTKHTYFSADEDYTKIVKKMKSAALLPVVVAGAENSYVMCPTRRVCYLRGKILERGGSVIFNLLYQGLTNKGWDIVLPEKVNMDELSTSPVKVAREVAKRYGVDGVFIPYLFRYQEREGSSLAVRKTASIVMALFLYSAKNNTIIWQGDFSQTQEPLSENLLDLKTSIRARFRFMTVDELADWAVRSILKGLPNKG